MPDLIPPPTTVLMAPAVAAINHLLAQEEWARAILKPSAGKLACIEADALALRLRVVADGSVELVEGELAANVTIRLKLADLPLIAHNRDKAFSYVKIDGDADFANTISQVARGLRWEAEHDLEPWIGPIAANRIVAGARAAFDTVKSTRQKVAENLAEFFLEEQPLLVRPAVLDDYTGAVARLRDDVERAAKRLARLEQKLAQRSAPGQPDQDH
ncbi:MAG: SCP2 sterol-binding domain-containing protein [Pseudomonadota bacterium]